MRARPAAGIAGEPGLKPADGLVAGGTCSSAGPGLCVCLGFSQRPTLLAPLNHPQPPAPAPAPAPAPSPVATFETEAEAVEAANDCEFGLAGAVISADEDRCQRVAEALEVGIVWVNCSQPCFSQVRLPPNSWARGQDLGRGVGRRARGNSQASLPLATQSTAPLSPPPGPPRARDRRPTPRPPGAVGGHKEQRLWAGAGRVGPGELPQREAGHHLRQPQHLGLVQPPQQAVSAGRPPRACWL
jgi:hypothetical protein